MQNKLTFQNDIEGNTIRVYDNLLSPEIIEQLHRAILNADVSILGCSHRQTVATREVMFELDLQDFRSHRLNTVIMSCISSITQSTNYLCHEILGNFMRFGSNTFIHQDSENPEVMSALYFVNSNWHHDWGGELILFNSNKDEAFCVSPRPGRLVLFPARIYHRAGVPTRSCNETRITLSARYWQKEIVNKPI